MPIDIDALSEPELVDLNHRIVERLRFLHQIHAHQAMLKFSIGDRVTFEDGQGRKVEGTLTRYNRKSVTVIGADGRHWNIAPGFLRKADQAAASKSEHHRASKTITSRDGVSVSMHQSRAQPNRLCDCAGNARSALSIGQHHMIFATPRAEEPALNVGRQIVPFAD